MTVKARHNQSLMVVAVTAHAEGMETQRRGRHGFKKDCNAGGAVCDFFLN